MKDVIDLLIDAYRYHQNLNFERRDLLLGTTNKSEEAMQKWLDFFEQIECQDEISQEEKEQILEKELRNKYQIFKSN
jgi:hypothetical protein|tara:strand:- start:351 stop:581 length:231 start_codon:yes stop_codon:yes gene_type:complete